MTALVSLGALAVLAYGGFCALLYFTQRSMLYFPTAESQHTSAAAVHLSTDGVRLKIWHVARGTDTAVVYFGGNAEDVAWNIDGLAATLPSADLYLVNYRGYGGTPGEPSEEALYEGALAVYDYLVASKRAAPGRVVGWCRREH